MRRVATTVATFTVLLGLVLPAGARANSAAGHPCPGTPHVHDLRVFRVACGDARRAAREYLSSYAAYNAIGGGVVAFVTHRGAWRCSVVEPETEGSLPHFSCNSLSGKKGAMSFVASIAPMRGCPTFTSFSEAIVGGLVTRNSSCRDLEAFVERFPSYGPEVGGFPAPLTHIVVTWPSLLPNGHGPVPMNYTCTYRIPAGSTAEGWSCNDGYFAYGFQYDAVVRQYAMNPNPFDS